MQKFILFKDGKPWKGFYLEIDVMNAYSQAFDELLRFEELVGKNYDYAVYRFFKRFQPAKWVKAQKGYKSLMKEYIIGDRANDEDGIVTKIEWDELSDENRKQFNKYSDRFKKRLEKMRNMNDLSVFEPEYKISNGGGGLYTID